MHGPVYVLVWIVLLLLLAIAAWKRRWWPFGLYALGCLILLNAVLRDKGGWDDLADFATMLAIVFPIYLVGSIVWAGSSWIERRHKRHRE